MITCETEIIPLDPEDAPRLVALAKSHFNGDFEHQSAEEVAENLDGTPDNTFCLGLEEGGDLKGYLLAWVDASRVEGHEDELVIVIEEMVLAPSHRNYVFSMLDEVRLAAEDAGLSGLPVECELRSSTAATFIANDRVLERLGYRVAWAQEFFSEKLQEPLIWTRFEAA